MGQQDLINTFYDVDNLVTVKIELPTWDELRTAKPAGGTGYQGHRYEYHKAPNVTISGSKYPEEPHTFHDIGVIKKSYWGSFDDNKPSMRLDFTRYDKSNEKKIEKLIGTERLTLNNCKQDPGYLRQPMCYELFRQAGVPYFRCGFAKVFVNDIDMGLYVNMEPFRKPYLKNNFDNAKGNAYEIEYGQDINTATLDAGFLSFEGHSDYKDKKDLRVAAEIIEKEGLAGAKKVVDWDNFLKFWAMEILIKHRDGYTSHQNNTFAYNNVEAVENPTVDNVNIRFVPSGVDLTLSKDPQFWLVSRSVLGKLVVKDEAEVNKLKAQLKKYMETVFSAENYEKSLGPFFDRLEATMKAAGVKFDDALKNEIDIAKKSVKAAPVDGLNLAPWE